MRVGCGVVMPLLSTIAQPTVVGALPKMSLTCLCDCFLFVGLYLGVCVCSSCSIEGVETVLARLWVEDSGRGGKGTELG